MNDTAGVQAGNSRELIRAFDAQFGRLHSRLVKLVRKTPLEILYRGAKPAAPFSAYSVGENVLRAAAAIEQTFGGITVNLWDDPFEWTLPETLSTIALVLEYLAEVEATRARAFLSFRRDADLRQEVMVPSGCTRPLIDLLVETLAQAADFHGRATATLLFTVDFA